VTLGLPVTTWPGSPQGAGGIVLSSEMNASSIGSKSWPLEVHAAVTTPIYRCVKKQIGWPSSKWSTPTVTAPIDVTRPARWRRLPRTRIFSSTWRLAIPFLPNTFGDGTRYHRYSTNLDTYEATTHFNGRSTTVLDGDNASGLTYCLAHHGKVDGSVRTLMVAAIRYLDTLSNATAGGFSASASSWSIGPKPVHW